MIRDKVKPVPSPGDVTGDFPGSDSTSLAIGDDVAHADAAIIVQGSSNYADRCLDTVHAGCDASEMLQGGEDADHAVTAHPEETGVVEKGGASDAFLILRFLEESPDDDLVATRFAENGAPIELEIDSTHPPGNDTGGLASGVGVDHGKTTKRGKHFLTQSQRSAFVLIDLGQDDWKNRQDIPFTPGRCARVVRMMVKTSSRSAPARGRRGSRTHSLPRPAS